MSRLFYILIVIVFAVFQPLFGATNSVAFLEAGRLALEDGFADVAQQKFEQALDAGGLSDAERTEAAVALQQAFLLQKKYAELQEHTEKLLADGVISTNTAAYWRAAALFDNGEYAGATELLSVIATNLPDGRLGESALRMLALSQVKSGDIAGAVKSFRQFSVRYPKSDLIWVVRLDWGKALIFQDKLKEAVAVLEPVIKSGNPRVSAAARYWAGKSLLQMKEQKKGVETLEALLTADNVPAALRVNAALAVVEVRRQQGKTRDAAAVDQDLKDLQGILDGVKDAEIRRRVLHEICLVMLDGGRLADAQPLIKSYVAEKADASAAELQLRLGETLLEAGKYSEAVDAYQQYFDVFDNADGYARARKGSGWALLGAKRYAEAAQAFEKAYGLFNDKDSKMECLFKMGDARLLNEQYQKAQDIYVRFLDGFSESDMSAKAYFNIAVCQEKQGKTDESEKSFELVADRFRDSDEAREALMRIGGLREAAGDWKGAEKLYERMMKLYPDGPTFVKALYGRGMARYQQWKPEALDDFETIVKQHSDSQETEKAFFMRAMCLYRLGRDNQAFEICEEFIKRYPESSLTPRVRFWMGRFAYNTGDYERAEKEFSYFVEKYPKHELADAAMYRSGMTALKRKDYVGAIELFGRMVKQYPESRYIPDARFYQADSMCELGKFAGAILVFDEIINNFPDSELVPQAWGRKGDCQFTLGAEEPKRYGEAINSYRVVTHDPKARMDTVLQAQYKIGRSFEKQGKSEEALNTYYSNVMLPFLLSKEQGKAVSESEKVWFTRAALAASELVTQKNDWRQLIRVLNRIVEADVAISSDAAKQIKTIESEKWWLFY